MFGLLLIVAQFTLSFAETECKFGDEACWTIFANTVIPKMADGIPELGLEGLEKIHLKDFDLKDDKTNFKLTNAIVTGFKNTVIEDIRVYKDLKIARIVLNTNLTVTGDYTDDGTFSDVPKTQSGKMTLLLRNLHIEMMTPYKTEDQNGKFKMILKYHRKSFHSYGGIHFNFENNDKSNKDFDDKVNTMLNENWRVFEGYGAAAWSDLTSQIFNAIKLILASYDISQ